jgi:S-adenosylmethionine decarboxylase
MKNLAPSITRQRLVVEGFFNIKMDKAKIRQFFNEIAKELDLRIYGNPTIHATGKTGKAINQGFDAFVPLIDSGIALYVWGNAKFFSTVIYTCKRFDNKKAIRFIKKFFKTQKVAYERF